MPHSQNKDPTIGEEIRDLNFETIKSLIKFKLKIIIIKILIIPYLVLEHGKPK
jgi:hypothetical protein